jgi:uncharacterized membrane protein
MNHSRILKLEKFAGSLSLDQWLLASAGFSCSLVFIRMVATGQPSYLFLPWNLFLAFIPLWISGLIETQPRILSNRILLVLLLGAWLLFFPNSFYIITDLFHLKKFRLAPEWYDLLMIFSFAWNGILFGIISLRRIEKIIQLAFGRNYAFLFIVSIMWLSAFGIYIGRFLRFNSWDILTDPFSLAREIVDLFIHPFTNGYAWGMTICYAVFMSLGYLTIRKMTGIFNHSLQPDTKTDPSP